MKLLGRQPDAHGGAGEAASSREALETALRLQRAADALISARTPKEVLEAVITEGVRAAEARGGLIATLSDDGEWLDVVASRGYDSRYIEPFNRFPLAGNFPLSEAVRTGEGVFLRSERERDERYPELVGRSQPGHALVCLPLVGEHGPMGGLVFSFSTDQDFHPRAGRSSSRAPGKSHLRSSGRTWRWLSRTCARGSASSARRLRCSRRHST